MSHTRNHIHAKYCADLTCVYNGIDSAGDACKNLDFMLTLAEDERVHAEVEKLLEMTYEVTLLHGAKVMQGLVLAIKTVDPYEHADGQYRRKSDGRPLEGS